MQSFRYPRVFSYTGLVLAAEMKPSAQHSVQFRRAVALVDRRIKPYLAEVDALARRGEQRNKFKRNQAFGLLLLAAAVLIWWLIHTNPAWIFPAGWWRP